MKILFTGATGFIGGHIHKQLLKTNHTIHVISRQLHTQNELWHQIDFFDRDKVTQLVANIKPDILIHFAWDTTYDGFWHADNNKDYASASKHLFDMVVQNGGKKIIAAGSCAEYPTSAVAVEEVAEFSEQLSPYGAAKRSAYKYLEQLKSHHRLDYTWLRIFGVYGDGEDERRLFPAAIRAANENRTLDIKTPPESIKN